MSYLLLTPIKQRTGTDYHGKTESHEHESIALSTLPSKEEPQSIIGNTSSNKESNDLDHRCFLPPPRSCYYYCPEKTTFLVSTNTQPGMGPVWVPFQEFGSASSFLSYMAGECHPEDWNPNTQLNSEISCWASPSSSLSGGVIAATVRFDWNGFVIRVRRGKDQDWAVVMRELQESWASSSSPPPSFQSQQKMMNPTPDSDNFDSEGQGFRISVMLHIKG